MPAIQLQTQDLTLFKSFFPSPVAYFTSLIVWSMIAVGLWYGVGDELAGFFGFSLREPGAPPVIGLGHFTTPEFKWFGAFVGFFILVFCSFWIFYSRHKWAWWSVLGTCFILSFTYFSVQVSVALNNWRRPMFDQIQGALTGDVSVTAAELYGLFFDAFSLIMLYIFLVAINLFIVSHYVFRWRTAMNDYYVSYWSKVRSVEGASQRVQEDTMRFAGSVESLGVSIVDAVMTLIAFLPILYALSEYVPALPLLGEIPVPLVTAAILWSLFGTVLLATVGIKLPGLEFKNQRVEAAYRKELVYGEDDADRAQPPELSELFSAVRKNYFRLYWHYFYFNIVRYCYLQADNFFVLLLLIPTVAAGQITFGIFQQITSAFNQVASSFQFLVNSWTRIIDLISIYKRLRSFEAVINDQELVDYDIEFNKYGHQLDT